MLWIDKINASLFAFLRAGQAGGCMGMGKCLSSVNAHFCLPWVQACSALVLPMDASMSVMHRWTALQNEASNATIQAHKFSMRLIPFRSTHMCGHFENPSAIPAEWQCLCACWPVLLASQCHHHCFHSLGCKAAAQVAQLSLGAAALSLTKESKQDVLSAHLQNRGRGRCEAQ